MASGRKPIPEEVRKAQFDRINSISELPTAPDYFFDEAKDVWLLCGTQLVNAKLLTSPDLPLLEAYAFQCGLMVRLQKRLRPGGDNPNPTLNRAGRISEDFKALQQATNQVCKLAGELGLSPSARGKSKVKPQSPTQSKLEDFLNVNLQSSDEMDSEQER